MCDLFVDLFDRFEVFLFESRVGVLDYSFGINKIDNRKDLDFVLGFHFWGGVDEAVILTFGGICEHGVSIGSVYDPPTHLHPVYQQLFGFQTGMFHTAEATLKRVFCLPMSSQMTDEEVDYVLQSLKKVLPSCQTTQVRGGVVD